MTVNCYIADCLRLAGENKYPTVSLAELMNGDIKPQKTAEEVEKDIISEFERLGGGASGNNSI